MMKCFKTQGSHLLVAQKNLSKSQSPVFAGFNLLFS